MPLIMDEQMDVDIDDLFGDGTELPLASQPPPKELLQRIDELREGGACQRVAWSRTGSVASISQDGSELEFRALHTSPTDGTWQLSRPTVMTPFRSNTEGGPIKHIHWSTNGSDIAVIDSAGRVSMLTTTLILNRPELKRDCRTEITDDLHKVVGTYWLALLGQPPNRPSIAHGPAVKADGKYNFETAQMPTLSPCFPSNHKSAFLCVTTNGLLRLFWSTNTWYEVNTELESVTCSDDLITHAAICPDKNTTLLIAYTTVKKQLRVIRAAINWGVSSSDKMAHGLGSVNPVIHTRHVAVTNWLADITTSNSEGLPDGLSLDQVSLLEFLPPSPDPQGRATMPTILMARTSLPSSSSLNQETRTIIDRWEVADSSQSLHPAFEQLGRKSSTGGNQPAHNIVALKKLEPVSVNKVLLNIERIILGKYLFLGYSDGSVEYRNRRTMAEMYTEGNPQKFTHLSQINFGISNEEPCTSIITSPSNCSVAYVSTDGKLKWKGLEYQMGDLGTSPESESYAAAIAAFSMACGTSLISSVNFDDVLATAQKYVTSGFAFDWLVELSRLLKIPFDYSEETHHDVLMRNSYVQMLLGIHTSIGYKGDFDKRLFGSKLSTVALQLRNIVVLITMAHNMKLPALPNGHTQTPLDDPNIVSSLVGPVRWSVDLFHWIMDQLLELAHGYPNTPVSFTRVQVSDISASLIADNNIILHLLLSSATRGFLIALCRRIAHIGYIASKAEAMFLSSNSSHITRELREAYTAISTQIRDLQLPIGKFEKILTDISTAARKAYATNPQLALPVQNAQSKSEISASANPRTPIELTAALGGPIHHQFAPVLDALFNDIVPALRAEIEPENLFFKDYSLLQLADNEAELRRRRKRPSVALDSLRKVEIRVITPPISHLSRRGAASASEKAKVREKEGAASANAAASAAASEAIREIGRFRRCCRCAGPMENILAGNRSPIAQWMVQQQKKCYCGGSWLGLPESETGDKLVV